MHRDVLNARVHTAPFSLKSSLLKKLKCEVLSVKSVQEILSQDSCFTDIVSTNPYYNI